MGDVDELLFICTGGQHGHCFAFYVADHVITAGWRGFTFVRYVQYIGGGIRGNLEQIRRRTPTRGCAAGGFGNKVFFNAVLYRVGRD